jgi:hypothetical protein
MKYGSLVVGDRTGKWMLSPSGVIWYRGVPDGTVTSASDNYRKGSVAEKMHEERARMQNTRAYLLHQQGRCGDISRQDYYEFARVNEYFADQSLNRRFAVIDNTVVGVPELELVWSYLRERFGRGE